MFSYKTAFSLDDRVNLNTYFENKYKARNKRQIELSFGIQVDQYR